MEPTKMYSGDMAPSSQTVISQKLEELFAQSDRIQGVLKDCYSVSERLRAIGTRVDSVNHPDNLPEVTMPGGKLGDGAIGQKTTISDGLIGQLDRLIANNNEFLREFKDRAIDGVYKNLIYIEKHI